MMPKARGAARGELGAGSRTEPVSFWSRLFRGSIPWVVLLFCLANLLAVRWQTALHRERAANLLTNPERAEPGGFRYDWSVGEDLGRSWPRLAEMAEADFIVLCGMSQMYAINEQRPSDETISERMDDALSPEGTRVIGLAAPNLDNEESLLLLLSSCVEFPHPPTTFLYGVCFDKMRNVGVRPGYSAFLRERPNLLRAWRETALESAAEYSKASAQMLATLEGATAPAADDRSVEGRLRQGTARLLPLVAARGDLNAQAQLGLFFARNWVFRIKPASKRPMLQGRYDLNVEFLRIMSEVAADRGVALCLYVVPLNPRAENPYVAEQYGAFKQWIEGFCRQHAVPFADLDDVVPSEAWGTFMGGPDYKHFKGEGHRVTADALLRVFGPVIRLSTRGDGAR